MSPSGHLKEAAKIIGSMLLFIGFLLALFLFVAINH